MSETIRVRQLARRDLDKVGVDLVGAGRLECRECQTVWSPNVGPGGRMPRGWWQCPNGCNKDGKVVTWLREKQLGSIRYTCDLIGVWVMGHDFNHTGLYGPWTLRDEGISVEYDDLDTALSVAERVAKGDHVVINKLRKQTAN